MSAFYDAYVHWAGPNVFSAIASAILTWWLLNRGRPRYFQHALITVGSAVVAVLILSAVLAAFGVPPQSTSIDIGIIAGVLAGFFLRAQPEAG